MVSSGYLSMRLGVFIALEEMRGLKAASEVDRKWIQPEVGGHLVFCEATKVLRVLDMGEGYRG